MASPDMEQGVTQGSSGAKDQEGTQEDRGEPVSVIEISVYSDGSIEVEVETGEQEESETSGSGEESGATPVQVKNKEEALALAGHAIDAAVQGGSQTETNVSQQAAGYAAQ